MLRRDFLSASSLVMGMSSTGIASAAPIMAAGSATTFKNILDYGAMPDGKTLNTNAIQRAIDYVHDAGGGLVYAPPGTFLFGGLELKSRVTLYLEAGCVLLGSPNLSDYEYRPGLPHGGSDIDGYHVIFARGAEDISICGLGTVDGNGEAWWEPNPNRHTTTPDDEWRDVASGHVQAKYNNSRPSPMVELVECRNVHISGITLKNSAGWTMRPINCESVYIDGIRIRNPFYGRNTDGMDITSCRNVFVCNCDIVTGDDAICLKSENEYGTEVLPTKNIVITNCTISTSCNGFKMGTATRGAFENIVFSNSAIYGDNGSPMMNRVIGGLSIETVDGGSVDGVTVSNIRMQNVRAPIFVRLGSRNKKEGSFLRNVLIEGIDAAGATVTSSITGVAGFRPTDISVSDCRIRTVEEGQAEWVRRDIPEVAEKYPESWMMGRLPAYGFYVRHADRVRLRNVEYIADKPDARPGIVADDVEDIILAGLELSAPTGSAPVLDLRNTRRAFLTGMRAPEGPQVFAQFSGADSKDNVLLANSVNKGQQAVAHTGGALEDSTRTN